METQDLEDAQSGEAAVADTGAVETSSDQVDEKPELKLVTEGYYRFTDIIFEWSKMVDPWQANAIRALVNKESLTHPDHPLHREGENGIIIYYGYRHNGLQRMLFSLKQVEYLQYYIHEMRLADPEYVIWMNKQHSDLQEDKDFVASEKNVPPPWNEESDRYVPMPGTLTLPEEYESIEEINYPSSDALKKAIGKTQRLNKRQHKFLANTYPPSEAQATKEEAKIDNNTPGPGLHRGPRRFSYSRRRNSRTRDKGSPPVDQSMRGNFSLQQPRGEQVPASEVPQEVEQPPVEVEENADTVEEDDGEKVDLSTNWDYEDAPTPEPSLGDKLDKLNSLAKEAGLPGVDIAEPNPHSPEIYFHHARQAAILASAGGLRQALKMAPKGDAVEGEVQGGGRMDLDDDDDDDDENDNGPPKEIGRSLFVSLSLTTWEEDPMTVLEVGWAAVWWQENLENDKTLKDDVHKKEGDVMESDVSKKKGEETDTGFEMMSDQGHYIIQAHMLEMKNNPNDSRQYRFGSSLPIPLKDLKSTIQQTLKDLSAKAGGGPIYIVLHSTDSDESELKKIGWKISGWEKALKPADWEYASYASEEGVGKVFVIDTAILFGAIEDEDKVAPVFGKTRKHLEEVANIMFGQDKDRISQHCGNAGNKAYYNLQVYLSIAQGPPLEELRDDYCRSQSSEAAATGPITTAATSKDVAAAPADTSPIAAQKSVEPVMVEAVKNVEQHDAVVPVIEVKEDEEEEDSDSEKDMIKGVYYEDESGNLVEVDSMRT